MSRTVAAEQTNGESRFSTDDLPASGRLPHLREVIGPFVARLDLSPVERRPLRWASTMHRFEGLAVVLVEANGLLADRSRSLLSDGNDDFLVTINRSGFSVLSQIGRECRVDTGWAALTTMAEAGVQNWPAPASWFNLRIPRRRLAGLVRKPEDALIRPIQARSGPLGLLLDYFKMALRGHRLASVELRQLFVTHVCDLVALAVGATRDADQLASRRGLRAARLNGAKGEIMRRLEAEGLTVADVAARLGVTPRYVQRLFETEGTTFTEYVTEQRLARAYRMLADARFLGRTITAIAFEVGFGNLSYFNRLFRRHYGATPSDVRAAAQSRV